MLEITSTTKGLLIPRMTTTNRDAIAAPAEGLQIYNETTNKSDIYIDGVWKSFAFSTTSVSNLVYVYSLADLPPVTTGIVLDPTKMYVFSGVVNIGSNFININGAGLRGTDPQKDMILSNVSGAVLRSTNKSIFIQDLAIALNGASTKAFDVSDSSGLHYFNSFSGSSVVDIVPSLGVGQISGFKAITVLKNFWKVKDGVKITGNVGKFTSALNFVEGITGGGSAIEFLSGVTILDIDLSNNYFIYTGGIGIKVNNGAIIDRGRMTTNMFRDVTTPLSGIDSYSTGWSMSQNTNIPDSRAYGFVYFNGNSTVTTLPTQNFYTKILGTTTLASQKRFESTVTNQLTYKDKEPITAKISVVISAKANESGSQYSIGIRKNNEALLSGPVASMASTANNQSFQIILNSEIDLVFNDFISVFISRTNGSTNNTITVSELQFRVTD